MTPAPARLAWWRAPTWASGQIAVQVFRDVPSLLLLFYMTQVLAIPPAMAGVAIFGPKLFWAVICDYGVGVLSDRWRHRFARRHFLLIGALLGPLAIILLFQPPGAALASDRAIHIALVLALYMSVFAVFSVPHLTIGTELTAIPAERTTVMAWRIVAANIGLLVGASFAPILLERLGRDTAAYQTTSYILAAIIALALVVSWLGSREPVVLSSGEEALVKGGNWRAAFANRSFIALFGAQLLSLTSSGITMATLAYLVAYRLAVPQPFVMLGVIGLIAGVTGMCSQPFWVALANRIGPDRGYLVASIAYAGSLLFFVLLPRGETIPIYLAGVAVGVGNAGTYLNAFAMLGEIVGRDAESGQSRAGFYSSLIVANDKVSFALGGTLLTGLVLQYYGFREGAAIQDERALTGIGVAFAGLPMLLIIGSFLIIALLYRKQR